MDYKRAFKKDMFGNEDIQDRETLELYPLVNDFVKFIDRNGIKECNSLYVKYKGLSSEEFARELFNLLNGFTSPSNIVSLIMLLTTLSENKINLDTVKKRLLMHHKNRGSTMSKTYESMGFVDANNILESYITSELMGAEERIALALISDDLSVTSVDRIPYFYIVDRNKQSFDHVPVA